MRRALRAIWRLITFPIRWIKGIVQEIRKFFMEEPEDAPLGDSLQKAVNDPQSLLVHVDALRKHLTRAVIVLGLATLISFAFASKIINFLARPVGGIEGLVAIDPTEPIGTFMRVSLLSGFAIALPYIILELWMFVAPGLSREARLFGLEAIPIVVLFFLGGVAFAYFIMLPTAIQFLIEFGGMTTQLRPSTYIRFVTNILFGVGAAFQFPLIIYVLARMGIIRGKVLKDQWRLAIVIIAILSAAITPTVDPVNMSLVMGPMIVLYLLSIGLAQLAERTRTAKQMAENTISDNP
jgi:sec-independent protein translocase protein TatC